MLREGIEWLLTPSSREARRLGHLHEVIAIAARARRCQTAWAPHLAASQAALLASASACVTRRVALLLGSGPLLDVPLQALAGLFEEVWLVDIVQPRSARRAVGRYRNVRLIEHDVSECLGALIAGAPSDLERLARKLPSRFLDEPRVDWVASLNLVSQLPRLPMQWLQARQVGVAGWDETTIDAFGETLMHQHLHYLASFGVPVCLITDLEQWTLDADGEVLEHTDLQPLFGAWQLRSAWRWDVAPPGELAGGHSAWHRVAVLARA